MTISTSNRHIKVSLGSGQETSGTISLTLQTDFKAHAKLSVIPQQELSILLNESLTMLTDSVLPQIENLVEKYSKGYAE